MLLLSSLAGATTVAVVDFVGVDVASTDLATAADGVRTALLDGGHVDPLAGPDIRACVARDRDEDLRQARAELDTARRAQADGDLRGCRSALLDARADFQSARAAVAAPDELADAWFLDGLCALGLGSGRDAEAGFAAALALVPDYDSVRTLRLPTSALSLLSSARDDVRERPPSLPGPADELAAVLDVDFVVAGRLHADGTVELVVYDHGGTQIGQVQAHAAGLPADLADPAWTVLADGVVRRIGLAAREPEPTTTRTRPATTPAVAVDDDEDEPRAVPVVRQWWFWAGIALVLGGGAAAAAVASQPAPTTETEGAPSYDVTVIVSD